MLRNRNREKPHHFGEAGAATRCCSDTAQTDSALTLMFIKYGFKKKKTMHEIVLSFFSHAVLITISDSIKEEKTNF
jgi:hypothetical protein